uniref:Uncharacterized protein n=1 Tax=Chromera velia CCMP2878 TaxID=1169474 RepID=A0A0G4G550_9ALVE|eukprot:Cvel_20225.t1-p1 / transcript=Cvel_20225.t1 / gene=Cvel_20225 / organism=Chromera_velia_CCMP2878 / gene_product=hypothetical protein / transcript_product=hypothetical protein / location=Cvel_scaffold1801:4640-7113(+) / protein_length=694 / sequence_SO=supercontig / SO=protein_coding / is_pseudo=false
MDTPTPTVGLQPRRRILSNFPIRPPPAFPPLLSSGEWDSPVSRVGPVRGGARVPPCFTWSPLESPHPLPSAEQQQPQQRAEGREDLGRHTQSVFTDKGGLRANAPAERESEGPTRTSTRASSSSACPIVPSTSNVLECSHEGGNGHVRGGGEAAEVATERHEEVEEEEESPKSGRDPEVSSHPRHWQSRERGSAVPRNYQNREEVGVKESCPLSGGKMGGEGQKEERKRSSSRIVKGSLASLLWGLRHLPEEVLPVVLDFVALDGECREYAEAKKWWCQKASSSVPRVGALPSISHQLQQQSEHTTTGSSGRRSALNRPTTQHPAVGSLTHTRTTRGGTPTSRVPRPPSTQAVCPDGCREQGGTRGQSRRPLHLEPLSLSVALADSGRGSREPPKAQNQKGGSSRLPVQGDVSNSTPEGQEGCFAFPRVPAPSSSVCPPPFPPDGHYAGSPVSFRRRRPNVPPPVDTRFAQLSGVLLHSREGGRGFGLSWFPAEGADSPTTVEQQHPSHTAATGSASSSFACWPPESSTHQQVLTASLSARVDEPLSGDASPLFWEGPEGGRGDGCEWTGEAASMSVHKDLCKRAERGECVPPYLHQQKGFCSAAGRGERVARRNRPSAPAVPNRSPPAEIHPSCLPSSFSSGRGHTGGEGGYSRGGGEGQRERGTVVDMSPCTLLLRKKVNSLRFAGLEWPPM